MYKAKSVLYHREKRNQHIHNEENIDEKQHY